MAAMQPVEKESRPLAPASHVLTWYCLGTLAAIGIGALAAMLNLAGYAPVGILPIGVGVALGAILFGLAAITQVNCRKRLIVGAMALAMVSVLTEHVWLYRDFRRQWHEARANSPHLAMFRPETPWSLREYAAHEATPQQLVLWSFDAALIVATSAATVAYANRHLRTIPQTK